MSETGCECEIPTGSNLVCPRHQCEKSPNLVKLCHTRQKYFDLWESGNGPCIDRLRARIPVPKSRGLGDTVAKALRKVGIKKKCGGCSKRQAFLNRLVPYKRG